MMFGDLKIPGVCTILLNNAKNRDALSHNGGGGVYAQIMGEILTCIKCEIYTMKTE